MELLIELLIEICIDNQVILTVSVYLLLGSQAIVVVHFIAS